MFPRNWMRTANVPQRHRLAPLDGSRSRGDYRYHGKSYLKTLCENRRYMFLSYNAAARSRGNRWLAVPLDEFDANAVCHTAFEQGNARFASTRRTRYVANRPGLPLPAGFPRALPVGLPGASSGVPRPRRWSSRPRSQQVGPDGATGSHHGRRSHHRGRRLP